MPRRKKLNPPAPPVTVCELLAQSAGVSVGTIHRVAAELRAEGKHPHLKEPCDCPSREEDERTPEPEEREPPPPWADAPEPERLWWEHYTETNALWRDYVGAVGPAAREAAHTKWLVHAKASPPSPYPQTTIPAVTSPESKMPASQAQALSTNPEQRTERTDMSIVALNQVSTSIPTTSAGIGRPIDLTYFEPWKGKPGKFCKPTAYQSFYEFVAGDMCTALEKQRVTTAEAVEEGARAVRTHEGKAAAKGETVAPDEAERVRLVAMIDAVKGGLLSFAPAVFNGAERSKEACELVTVSVGDYDNETAESWGAATATLDAAGVAWASYGSPKDGIPKTSADPARRVKRRLLIALSRSVTPKESARLRAVVPALLGLEPDATTVGDESRLFYLGKVDDREPALEGNPEAQLALDVDAVLAAHPEPTKAKKERKPEPEPRSKYAGISSQPAASRRRPAGVDPLDYARALARTAPVAVQGGDDEGVVGHTRLFNIACDLVLGLGIEPEPALEILWDEYNERCEPPWDPQNADHRKQFEHKVAQAAASDERTLGYLLPATSSPDAPFRAAGGASRDPRIIVLDGQCFLSNGNGGYHPPVKEKYLAARLTNLGLDGLFGVPRKGASQVIDVQKTIETMARVALHAARDFTASDIRWDHEAETLTEGYVLPTIVPHRDLGVEAWLDALSGGALDEIHDWIAGCRQDRLSQPGAALLNVGPADIGKSMLAKALARLWGCADAVALKTVVAQFNGRMTDCPIWFDDECEAIKAGLITSAMFRQRVQARVHDYERKGQERRLLHGCARLIIGCNEPSDFRFPDISGPSAVGAVVDRLAMFVVPVERGEDVRAALAKLRPDGEQDVDLDRIVGHLAWVQANVTPKVQRFLGAHKSTDEAERAAYSGAIAKNAALFELMREYLTSGGAPDRTYRVVDRAPAAGTQAQSRFGAAAPGAGAGDYRLVSKGDGWLYALPSALAAAVAQRGRDDVGAVHEALKTFRNGDDRVQMRFGGFTNRFFRLDAWALCTALGLTLEELDAAELAVSQATTDRMGTAGE